MSTGLIVTDKNELTEMRPSLDPPQHPAVRFFAKLVSYIFHPLFIPVYLAWFMVKILPTMFAGASNGDTLIIIARYFVTYTVFPLVTVLLARALGFLDSIYLRTRKERIIPFIASNIYYFWMCFVIRHDREFGAEAIQLSLAIFIASSFGLLLNIYMKVSLHAISMGVLASFMILLGLTQSVPFGLYISIAFLVAGIVCTARFIVSDHSPREVYLGFLCGLVSMALGVWADKILP